MNYSKNEFYRSKHDNFLIEVQGGAFIRVWAFKRILTVFINIYVQAKVHYWLKTVRDSGPVVGRWLGDRGVVGSNPALAIISFFEQEIYLTTLHSTQV